MEDPTDKPKNTPCADPEIVRRTPDPTLTTFTVIQWRSSGLFEGKLLFFKVSFSKGVELFSGWM